MEIQHREVDSSNHSCGSDGVEEQPYCLGDRVHSTQLAIGERRVRLHNNDVPAGEAADNNGGLSWVLSNEVRIGHAYVETLEEKRSSARVVVVEFQEGNSADNCWLGEERWLTQSYSELPKSRGREAGPCRLR